MPLPPAFGFAAPLAIRPPTQPRLQLPACTRAPRHITLCSAHPPPRLSRRAVLALLFGLSISPLRTPAEDAPQAAASESPRETDGSSSPLAQPSAGEEGRPIVGRQTTSGITFIDFTPGEGRTPNWGDLVNIDYVLYTINDTSDGLVEHESSLSGTKGGVVFHHGNGELIKGLEEVIHTMQTGNRRRCIIPASLAYTRAGLMPIPPTPRRRKNFINTIEQGDGTVVFDVRLNWIKKDPDDRGYYSDLVPTEKELLELFRERKGKDFD